MDTDPDHRHDHGRQDRGIGGAPHLTDDKELVAGYLGLANGLGFLAGAVLGYVLLQRALKPPRGALLDLAVVRTILVTTAASLLAGLIAYVIDRLLGLKVLTEHGGGAGRCCGWWCSA